MSLRVRLMLSHARAALKALRADYPTSIVALALCGSLFPYVIVIQTIDAYGAVAVAPAVVLLACAGSLLTGLALTRALEPLRRVAAVLDRVEKASADEADPGERLARAVENMQANIERLDADVAQMTASAAPPRARLVAQIDAHIASDRGPAAIGLVRFADLDRLAALNPKQAASASAAFAARVRQAVGPRFLLAEVGPAEFAVWFADASPDEGVAALRAIAYALTQDLPVEHGTVRPRLHVGGAMHPLDGQDAETLLARAYASLAEYQAGATLSFFSEEAREDARLRYRIEQDIAGAVRRGELSLAFQPIVDLGSSRLVGAEALLRWSHRDLGEVSPGVFVPIIEQSGAIDEIGTWVLNAACRQARAWKDAGLDLRIAVNLSACQLRNPALTSVIARMLERHRLAPQDLELELTETATMEDAARTLAVFRELHALGVGLAIDDFGSGYSSLSYLKELPFTKLKIDRAFVTAIAERPHSNAICRALVELSKGLGIRLLAEGVEDRLEVETLRALGCTLFQGYYFGRPMRAEEFSQHAADPAFAALLASPAHRGRREIESRILS